LRAAIPGGERRAPIDDARDVEREIAALDGLDLKALQQRWRELYNVDPPAKLRSGFLRRAIAYRLQEIVYGGLQPQTVRAMRRIAEELRAKRARSVDRTLGSGSSARSATAAPILSSGTRLLREWNGRMEAVEVTGAGFVWRDQTYRTLSAVAVAITGTKWSGPKFFGLTGKRPRPVSSKKASPASQSVEVS
jgi:hypothetical protein